MLKFDSALFTAVALLYCATASAQPYPGRQIRIILPFVLVVHPGVSAQSAIRR